MMMIIMMGKFVFHSKTFYLMSLMLMAAVQHWYSNLSLTNTNVTAVRTSGFTPGFQYSVYPCLCLFHETYQCCTPSDAHYGWLLNTSCHHFYPDMLNWFHFLGMLGKILSCLSFNDWAWDV